MRMFAVAVALLSLLIVGGAAAAVNWVSVLKSDDGSQEAFIDPSSVRSTGVTRQAWVKNVFKAHFDCAAEKVHSESATNYYEDGTHQTDSTVTSPEPVPPETMLSAVMQVACALPPR